MAQLAGSGTGSSRVIPRKRPSAPPGPAPIRPLFVPTVKLDPSQVVDRRGQKYKPSLFWDVVKMFPRTVRGRQRGISAVKLRRLPR